MRTLYASHKHRYPLTVDGRKLKVHMSVDTEGATLVQIFDEGSHMIFSEKTFNTKEVKDYFEKLCDGEEVEWVGIPKDSES